jgi:hypothetical protein
MAAIARPGVFEKRNQGLARVANLAGLILSVGPEVVRPRTNPNQPRRRPASSQTDREDGAADHIGRVGKPRR